MGASPVAQHRESCNAGDTGDMDLTPWSGRSPRGGKKQPTPVFLPEKSHGQRSLESYYPWGNREPEMT